MAMRPTNSFSTCPSRRGQKDRESAWDASASDVEDVSHHHPPSGGDIERRKAVMAIAVISRNHKKDSENLHRYRSKKVSAGKRTIRKQHYAIQPHDIVIYDGRKVEVSGCQHKGKRVVFLKTKRSVQTSKVKLFKHAGGYFKSALG